MKKITILYILLIFFTACSKEEAMPEREYPTSSAFVNPEVGGANQPNQVFVDLSTNTTTTIRRDSWDLGFYSEQNMFRVGINGSIYMATKALPFTDIDAVSETDVQSLFAEVAIGTFDPINVNYVDDFDGDINHTAIATISEIDSENTVYLLNMGYAVGTDNPDYGSVAIAGEHRGWKKIRILRDGENYLLQYASLEDTTHQEITITKDSDYHFTFFSLSIENNLIVQPTKTSWDLCFTVFTNEISGYGTYGYADFIVTNSKSEVEVYQIEEEDTNNDGTIDNPYSGFVRNHVVEADFITTQRAIGSGWRFGGGPGYSPHVKDNVYYILRDTEGIYYKLKFLTIVDENGERGFPQFQYELLQ